MPGTSTRTSPLTLRVPLDLRARLAEIAARDRRSLADVLLTAARATLDTTQAQAREALAPNPPRADRQPDGDA